MTTNAVAGWLRNLGNVLIEGRVIYRKRITELTYLISDTCMQYDFAATLMLGIRGGARKLKLNENEPGSFRLGTRCESRPF